MEESKAMFLSRQYFELFAERREHMEESKILQARQYFELFAEENGYELSDLGREFFVTKYRRVRRSKKHPNRPTSIAERYVFRVDGWMRKKKRFKLLVWSYKHEAHRCYDHKQALRYLTEQKEGA